MWNYIPDQVPTDDVDSGTTMPIEMRHGKSPLPKKKPHIQRIQQMRSPTTKRMSALCSIYEEDAHFEINDTTRTSLMNSPSTEYVLSSSDEEDSNPGPINGTQTSVIPSTSHSTSKNVLRANPLDENDSSPIPTSAEPIFVRKPIIRRKPTKIPAVGLNTKTTVESRHTSMTVPSLVRIDASNLKLRKTQEELRKMKNEVNTYSTWEKTRECFHMEDQLEKLMLGIFQIESLADEVVHEKWEIAKAIVETWTTMKEKSSPSTKDDDEN